MSHLPSLGFSALGFRLSACAAGAIALAASALAQSTPSDFLGGCTPRGKGGKAIYRMDNGELVGEAVAGSANTFLSTNREYGDFVLEYDFKVDPRLNSGVQIRSHALDQPTTFTDAAGKAQTIPAGKVHGYQIEIDTDPNNQGNRQWTAGLYEEGRRLWLVPGLLGGDKKAFSEQGRRLTKIGDWNHVKVEAVGPRIRTWLNGELRVDAMDGDTPRGFIGFQVHSVAKELAGTQNRWRNVKLTEVAPNTLTETEKAEGWQLLFDGRSTDAWRSFRGDTFPAKGWVVRDGTLTVCSRPTAASPAAGAAATSSPSAPTAPSSSRSSSASPRGPTAASSTSRSPT